MIGSPSSKFWPRAVGGLFLAIVFAALACKTSHAQDAAPSYGDEFNSNSGGDSGNGGDTFNSNSSTGGGEDNFNSNSGDESSGGTEVPVPYETPPPRFPCGPNAIENQAWGGPAASGFLGLLRPLIVPNCSVGLTPHRSVCRARTPKAAYIQGFQEGFTSCVIGTVLSPIVLMQTIMADFGAQFAAAESLLQGNSAGAAEILHVKGEENRLRNQQWWNSLVAMLNPNLIGVDPAEAGRRDGSRICQFWVIPQISGGLAPKKGFNPSHAANEWPGVGLNPKPPAVSSPTTITLSEAAYKAALRLPFPQQYANAFAVLADNHRSSRGSPGSQQPEVPPGNCEQELEYRRDIVS